MANLNIRCDDETKAAAEHVLEHLGMNMTTAVNVFLKQVIRTNGIPFPLELDPFYSETNQAMLRRSLKQLDRGEVVVKTMEELEAMANE